MFRSIVLFTWTESATEQQKAGVAGELEKLPGLIPELRRLDFGSDAGLRPGNADFGVVADFDSAADYLVYLDHPAHQALVANHIRPIVAGRTGFQHEIRANARAI